MSELMNWRELYFRLAYATLTEIDPENYLELEEGGEFTMMDLQKVHETIGNRTWERTTFARQVLATKKVVPSGNTTNSGKSGRPAILYKKVKS